MMEDSNETIDSLPFIMKEGLPFLRDGMTVKEYEVEKEYFGHHIKEYHEGVYKPLWQQQEEANGKR